jgi:hypothetical protein
MRLSDAGLRRRPTKLIYPNHRLPPWLIEAATPRSLEPIVRRPHTLTLVRAMTPAQLPAYTADCPLRNLRFLQTNFSNYGLSGGAKAVTLTLESARRRTLEAHWRCAFNHRRPLQCGGDFPSLTVTAQRSVPLGPVAAQTQRPSMSQLRSPHTATSRSPCRDTDAPPWLILKASNDEVERRGASPATNGGALSQTSTPSLAHRRRRPAIARTDC